MAREHGNRGLPTALRPAVTGLAPGGERTRRPAGGQGPGHGGARPDWLDEEPGRAPRGTMRRCRYGRAA